MKQKGNLTQEFEAKIEKKILTGEWKTGDKIPTLRELAEEYGVSRSVVNAGVMELTAKGYLKVVPRKRTEVNDWKKQGTLAVLNGILEYNIWSETVLKSLLDSRMLIMCDCAYNAALNRSDTDLKLLKEIIDGEIITLRGGLEEIIGRDLKFHHTIAVASGNIVYPLIVKSFENSSRTLVAAFYSHDEVYNFVRDHHVRLYGAIAAGEPDKAREIMRELLIHGERITKSAKKMEYIEGR